MNFKVVFWIAFSMGILMWLSMRTPGSKTQSAPPPPPIPSGNPAHGELLRMSSDLQAKAFGRVAECVGAEAFFMGIVKESRAHWSVRCDSGKAYQIQILPDVNGKTNIVDCGVLKAVQIQCFKKLAEQ
jgi:hypothetical protein